MKIIAESAFNHNGNHDYVKELARSSKNSGADYFTVQVMDADSFCVEKYSKREIYFENEITRDEWKEVFTYCQQIELDVIPCTLEEMSFDFCYEEGYRLIKLHATDICNEPFLRHISKYKDVRIILETQCATYQDIIFALDIIGPQVECLMHGFSNYPTELEDLNLNVLDTWKTDFNYKIGFADHFPGETEIALICLAKGADYFEKHITSTRNNRNFDWQVSLYPEQFASMISKINYFRKALGNGVKHPVKNELPYRTVMYKKVMGTPQLRRADSGQDYLTHTISNFNRNNVVVALIARLKSKRLPKKVLKKFHSNELIVDLYRKIENCSKVASVHLSTSPLFEDEDLVKLARNKDMNVFQGHPISVLDRMLSLSIEQKAGGVFRVTGDNPFTDQRLIDKMIELFIDNDLDYVRTNNVPFGVSAELFSTRYLWNLYLNMDNPMDSEYLSWFVLNDKQAKKGCINFVSNDERVRYVNLSVDYQRDLDRTYALLERIDKLDLLEISLQDVINNLDLNDIEEPNKEVKLPSGTVIKFKDYLDLIDGLEYDVKFELTENDIHNW